MLTKSNAKETQLEFRRTFRGFAWCLHGTSAACVPVCASRERLWKKLIITYLNQVQNSSTMAYFHFTECCLSHITSSEFTPAEMNRKQLNVTRSDHIRRRKAELQKATFPTECWPWFHIKRYFIKWNFRLWNLSIPFCKKPKILYKFISLSWVFVSVTAMGYFSSFD